VHARPDPSLSNLRDIAVRNWDIFAALGESAPPPAVTDGYLLHAADLLRAGKSDGEVADYIIDASIERIGVDTGAGIRERALIFVEELRSYLDRL
jgi:hypothetical protein